MFLGSNEKSNLLKNPIIQISDSYKKFHSISKRYFCLTNGLDLVPKTETFLQKLLNQSSIDRSLNIYLENDGIFLENSKCSENIYKSRIDIENVTDIIKI
jgi:hypothetical protein